MLALHRERQAKATIVLTPVDNPVGVRARRDTPRRRGPAISRKAEPDEITCDTINAGIYVLEPDTFDRIPKDVAYSIERAYFPSLVENGEPFVAHIDRGYWIDIGTPEKYVQVHRDMFDGDSTAGSLPRPIARSRSWRRTRASRTARRLEAPCFVDSGAQIKAGALVGPYAVIGRGAVVEEDARVTASIVWPNTRIGQHADVDGAILARNCHVGRYVSMRAPAVLGDKTVLTDYTKI